LLRFLIVGDRSGATIAKTYIAPLNKPAILNQCLATKSQPATQDKDFIFL